MSSRVALCGLVLIALLGIGPGCGEPRQVERQIQRPPLSLLRSQGGTNPARAIQPRFRDFDELTAGIKPRLPVSLPSQATNGPRTEAFFFPEQENNNAAKRATTVSLPAELSGHMDPLIEVAAGDEDWYTFLVEQDRIGVMDIELTGVTKLDLALEVYYETFSGRKRLVKVNNQGRGQGERLPNFSLPNGRYYLRVLQEVTEDRPARWDVVNAYQVKLTPKELSATEETEPNDGPMSALPLRIAEQMTGLINRVGDEDWYTVDLSRTSAFSRVQVELLPPMDTTLELGVFTAARQELIVVPANDGKRLVLPNIGVIEGAGGYLLSVRATGNTLPEDPYRIEVRTEALKERVELEPDNVPEAALRLFWEEPVSGYLSHPDDVDWFKLEPNHDWGESEDGKQPRVALNLVLAGVPGLDLEMALFDADGESPLATFDIGGKGDGEEAPNLAVPQRTTYVRVTAKGSAFNAGAPYILQARALPADGMEWEPNNTPEAPTVIQVMGDKVMGYLSPRGDRDCLRFAQPGLELQFKAAPQGKTKVSAYDPNGLLYFQRETDEKLTVPATTGPLTICLELAAEVEQAPRSPYIIMPVGDLAEP